MTAATESPSGTDKEAVLAASRRALLREATWAGRSKAAQRVYDAGDDPGSPEMRSIWRSECIRFHLKWCMHTCLVWCVSKLSLRQPVGRKPEPASGADSLCGLFGSPKRHGEAG